ncbi:MAG: ABC transporter permease [Desulfitobacteriaceae bacterium]|nr:ABC transporter permease [Desulfitobacteriaceae bacterium]
MSILARKLLRTIKNTKGQFLAVVSVVALGITVFIGMTTAYYNLDRSKENFYQQNNFADYYFQVIRAPEQVTRQIQQIPGVIKATGRIQKDVPLLKDNEERATARLISFPLPMEREVNRLHLLEGRVFEKNPGQGRVEVLVDPQFAQANHLDFNDQIYIGAEGKRVPLTVVGTATSPEFVYPIKDAATLLPDPENFAIVMIPLNQMQQVFNQSGEINQVVINLSPGADEDAVKKQVETILEPYGNLASFPQEQQLSHAVLQAELDGLKAMSQFLPALFLAIAASIQFIMLGRIVKTQRLQIGIMKAVGYGSQQILFHYTGYALSVGIIGAVIGTILGILLATVASSAYALYFNLPETIGGVNIEAVVYGFLLSLGVSVLAGLIGCRGVLAIHPAESMRPEPPKGSGKILLERWSWLWKRLDPTWKMSLRTIGRNKVRFGVVLLGIIFAVGLLVVSFFMNDSIDYMLTQHYQEEQRYNYMIRFTSPVSEYELLNISRLDGVVQTEAIFELPVRIHFHGRDEEDLIVGLPQNVTLRQLTGDEGENIFLPEEGVLIGENLATKLGIEVGDVIRVETILGLGPTRWADVKVAGINRQLIGGGSFMEITQVNRLLREHLLASGAMLKIDPGKRGEIEKALNEMTAISSMLSREKELDNFVKNLDSMIYFVGIMVFFAVTLGFAIVYNSAVVSFGERKRELASLRVVGFSLKEVSALLWKEYFFQAFMGIIFGMPFGYLMALSMLKALNTDLYSLPLVIYPATYAFSAIGGAVFIAAALIFTMRSARDLDLVDVLKDRD